MGRKKNPKAEKAKRNLAYARLHKKSTRPARSFRPRPAAPAPVATTPAPTTEAPAPAEA